MPNSEGKSTRPNKNSAISDMNNHIHMQQTSQKLNHLKGKAAKLVRRFTVRESKPHEDVTTNQDRTGRMNAAASPVPHLLRSNVPPSEEETLLIVQFIERAQVELEKVRLLKEASVTRSPELRRIVDTIESHRAVLSAVRRIPLELLQEIFLHMIPHASYEGYNKLYLDLEGAMLSWSFSQVSKFWRSAATHCPSLWRQLPLIDFDRSSTYKPDFVDILRRIMERTGDGPICVHFSSARCGAPIHHPALDLLLAHSHRWRGARISLSLPSFHALRLVESRLTLLEDLIIEIVPREVRDEDFPDTITFFRQATSLRRVYISGANPTVFALPQSYQLVEYQQESCGPVQAHLALGLFQPGVSSFGSLTRLSIKNFYPDERPWPDISLNNLLYLQIRFYRGTWPGWCLDALTLPCIEEIEISAHDRLLAALVLSMLQRSHTPSTTLRRLYLRSSMGYSATLELVALMRLTPYLTHLNVAMPPIEDLELLSADSGLSPCLRVCEFTSSEEFPLTDEVIRQLNIFAKLRCDLPQNNSTHWQKNNDMEHLEHRMLILYIHFSNYLPRNYAVRVHDWRADSQHLQELIELGRQLMNATSVTQPLIGNSKFHNPRKIASLLGKVNAYKVKSSKEIIISGLYNVIFHCTYYPSKQVSLLADKILKSWEPLLKPNSALDQLHWVLYNMQSLAYISQSNPTRFHTSISPSKLITGIQLLDCHPDYYSWPPIFI